MHEVIQSVLATEAEAEGMVAAARAEANHVAAAAQLKRQELVACRREEARVEAERIVAAAVHQAGREQQEGRARVAAEVESQFQLAADVRDRVVVAAVRCVCGVRHK